MATIIFTPGPQTAGDEVIDINGIHWTVLKNIGYATAQPREGAYYTKVQAPTIDLFAELEKLKLQNEELSKSIISIQGELKTLKEEPFMKLSELDFYQEESTQNIRVLPKN